MTPSAAPAEAAPVQLSYRCKCYREGRTGRKRLGVVVGRSGLEVGGVGLAAGERFWAALDGLQLL